MKYFLNSILFLTLTFSFPVYAKDDGSQFTSFAGIKLGKVTLTEVSQKFGDTEAISSGDAGEYEVAMCYKTKYGFIHFLSGEMGGGIDLIGFGASKNQIYKTCTKPNDPKSLLKLPLAGISIGMTKAEFSKVINKKVQWKNNVGLAFFESKRPMTKNEINAFGSDMQQGIESGEVQNYFDVQVSIEATFRSGVLTHFEVWKVETQ
jgi:hypothetical protein